MAGDAMRVKLNDRFLQSLKGPCRLSVIYFDDVAGSSFQLSASGQTWKVSLRGSKAWETASFDLPASAFKAAEDGAHIVIQNNDAPLCFHMVMVDRK